MTNGLLFAIIFAFYAGSLYFGGYLRWNDIKTSEDGVLYSGGRVITIRFCVVIGAPQLGGIGPAITAVQQGRVACKLAVNIIDQVPKVDSSKGGTVL